MVRFLHLTVAVAAALWSVLPLGRSAYATSVQPVVLDLTAGGRRSSATVEVENDFKKGLPVELRVEAAEFDNGELKNTGNESEDLLIFPPTALIETGRTQNFRIQYVGDASIAESRHYIITVAQLPVVLPGDQSVVQVLYNFQVITSVKPLNSKPALQITGTEIATGTDGKPRAVLLLENASNVYGYLSAGTLKLRLRDTNGNTSTLR